VGTALRYLHPRGIFVSSCDYNLTDKAESMRMFRDHEPDAVIHLAAKVGGIKTNMHNLGDFFRDNILINTNVLDSARLHGTRKVLSLLSTCIYPDDVQYPLTEDQIHEGAPHVSNYGYAYAKRMLDVQSRAYRDQYGCNFITAIPNNLFGENDNYHLEDSHVIPAIIRKMHEANLKNEKVKLWGDGTPLREFTYALDAARAILVLLENYDQEGPINIGNTQEISIKELAKKIALMVGYNNDIIWQPALPGGQHRKPSDNSKLRAHYKVYYTDFDKALRNTVEWFIMNYPKVRGIK